MGWGKERPREGYWVAARKGRCGGSRPDQLPRGVQLHPCRRSHRAQSTAHERRKAIEGEERRAHVCLCIVHCESLEWLCLWH